MAAGMGSRYGGGIKQLEHVGTSGEIIMEYSLYDAIRAGFDKVVFVTREELFDEFKKLIGKEVEKQIEVNYVFQKLENLPEGFSVPEGRTKPWGTGQAVLACKDVVNEPFAVINADDYYGSEAFVQMHDFLAKAEVKPGRKEFCMVGFVLKNTLSENGQVTRGVCKVNADNMLTNIEETFKLRLSEDKVVGETEDGKPVEIEPESPVSMNMWGFTPDFLKELEERFSHFLSNIKGNELKSEYLLPKVVASSFASNSATTFG
ncbi:MAG: nucleotidyltransferase, partial [Lachnospiraceae bacterium]|nr:nucleotidyltransferase [Lachnospiraceae bacterium]